MDTLVKPEEHGERLPRGRPNTSTLATTHVEQLHWPFCSGPNMGECKLAEQRENNTYLINNFFVLKEKNLKIRVILGQVLTKRYHLFILLYDQWLIFKWIKTGYERNLKAPILKRSKLLIWKSWHLFIPNQTLLVDYLNVTRDK